ncbi:MAG TPA: hypothetical protein VLB82_09310 [Thermodesulfobacteriota bacterium]|nr:hypothetical protein [Thermodesulfobacteriota bacterium]
MDDVKKGITETKVAASESANSNKKLYKKPELKNYGKLKDITLGGSPGGGDSGNPGVELPPGP